MGHDQSSFWEKGAKEQAVVTRKGELQDLGVLLVLVGKVREPGNGPGVVRAQCRHGGYPSSNEAVHAGNRPCMRLDAQKTR